MSINIKKKMEIVKRINKISNYALSAVVANSNKINVNKINNLRKEARKEGVKINIVKNTLLKKAIKNTPFECLKKILKNFTLIAYSINHPGSAAKLLYLFSKENKTFKIKGAAFEGKFINPKKIKKLSLIPTYKEAIQKLIIIIKELAIGKLVRLLMSIKKKKEDK
ncbi:MAG: 50S ribosomal protein L10 [Buchnera aphidicola (Periphyllus lyropictus)]|uniref:50S ribosomal protein L10 n=1 Tax=Buchnera aphidicola TaxID=9 RepID=UPI001EB6381D|nr:50S ribosomal protein L10 [Buchnera aphidicola]NIH16773.1 50S ribosomal protein L10 [Buchnera aphidicola (Periphyllus lyropictus)]USS94672.1 50S ribosomal protein L10 [Buchnera aphidicola (Periphyllus lyropictus)]